MLGLKEIYMIDPKTGLNGNIYDDIDGRNDLNLSKSIQSATGLKALPMGAA